MGKMKARSPLMPKALKVGANVFSYADSISDALTRNIIPNPSRTTKVQGLKTMDNTTGRGTGDDRNNFYYVSDGFNLGKGTENQFTSLLSLSNIASARSQLHNMQRSPIIPNIKSQIIAGSHRSNT